MGRLCQLGLGSFALAIWLVGCSTTGLMDATDDMSGSSSGAKAGSTDSACSACFETNCAWEVTECAAEPDCAKWLTCVRSAPADASGAVSAVWLENNCEQKMGPTAAALRDALAACLTDEACCTAGRPIEDTGGNTGPSAADGGAYSDNDASDELGGGPAPGAGDGGIDNGEGWDCPTGACQCIDCLYALKHGEVPQEAACTQAVQQCLMNEACNGFFGGFVECATVANSDTPNAAPASRTTLEACLFVEATGEWAKPGGFEQFMSTVYGCATGFCGNYCVAEDERSCAQCQQTWCAAELEAYLSDPEALLGSWCRSYCQLHPEDGQCPGKCTPHLQAGAETLQLFGQCVQTSCADDC